MAHGRLTLRAATPADDPFLLEVYASTRAQELEGVPWTDEQKAGFVRSQFDAQALAYRQNYPGASFLVIEDHDARVGRLYRWLDGHGDLRIMDIALLPEHRGRGIGTQLLGDVLAEADGLGLRVSLHVEEWSPAVRLYERLGFERVAQVGVYDRMERTPGGGGQVNTAS